jgi:hypothetical protein
MTANVDGRTISMKLRDAPTSLVRIVQLAAATGGFEDLSQGNVWEFAFDDWAVFLNPTTEQTTDDYDPWGEFYLEPRTAVVFRTGQLVGVTDETESEFFPAAKANEEDLVIDAIETFLDDTDLDYEARIKERDA